MANNDIIVSEMTPASQINTGDLMIMTQPDGQSETGYSTKSGTVLQVSNKMLKGTTYETDLPSFTNKNVLGGMEELKGDIFNLLPVDEASGSIANFETELAAPLQSVLVNVLATGGNGTPDNPNPINGYTEANITRSGVNLFDKTATDVNNGYIANSYIRNNGAIISDVDCNVSEYIRVGGDTQITLKPLMFSNPSICFYDNNKNLISGENYNSRATVTTTTPSNCAFIRFSIIKSNIDTTQLEIGNQASSYHAYTGNAYAIALGRTVYGGQLIILPDRTYFHVTHGKYTGTWGDGGSEYLPPDAPSVKRRTFALSPQGANYAANQGKALTNVTDEYSSSNAIDRSHFYVYDNLYLYLPIATSDDTVIECSYVLATPFDIDLTPQQIEALLGVNNVFADCGGDTSVKFKDTIQHYIDKKIAQTQALIL